MQDEEFDVVERILAGERDAYAILVRQYEARIRGYCLGVFRNAAQAEDAAQEVFIKAYKGLGGFQGKASFSTWLYRIAVNHCRDLLRKEGRNRMESWEALKEQDGEALEARMAVLPEAHREDERTEQVREALKRLPEQYKAILILREIEGLSYQELTQVLNCSMDAVKARLRRAREELQMQLKERV